MLVLFHSAFQLRTPIATVTSVSLGIVVCTGLIGLYLYALVPKGGLRPLEARLTEIEPLLPGLAREVRGLRPRDAADHAAARRVVPPHDRDDAALDAPGAQAAPGDSARRCGATSSFRVLERNDRRLARAFRAELGELAASEVDTAAGAALMRSWRSLHRFLAILMIVSVSVHIGVAWFYGFRWIFELMRRALTLLLLPSSSSSPSGAARAQLLSPGPLSRAHASLEGDTHCSSCHSSGKRVDQNACFKCHTELGSRVAAGQGLHGAAIPRQPCEQCHVEHLGAAPADQVARRRPDEPRPRAHRLAAERRPPGAACTKCHTKTDLGRLDDLPRPLDDVHDVPQGSARRTIRCKLHELPRRDGVVQPEILPQGFNHELARASSYTARTRSGRVRQVPLEPAEIHGPPVRRSAATATKIPTREGSARPAPTATTTPAWKPVTFRGANAKHPGVSLANGHAAVACRTCHDRGNLARAVARDACASRAIAPCTRPRSGARAAAATAPSRGRGCRASIGLASHPTNRLPAQRASTTRSRAPKCHKPSLPAGGTLPKARLRAVPRLPRGQARRRVHAHRGGRLQGVSFDRGLPADALRRRRARAARFALVGQHAAVAVLGMPHDARPRLDLHVTKQACADCHPNPHGDQFATEMAQGRVRGSATRLRAGTSPRSITASGRLPAHTGARLATAATTRPTPIARRAAARATAASRAFAAAATTTRTSGSSGSRNR